MDCGWQECDLAQHLSLWQRPALSHPCLSTVCSMGLMHKKGEIKHINSSNSMCYMWHVVSADRYNKTTNSWLLNPVLDSSLLTGTDSVRPLVAVVYWSWLQSKAVICFFVCLFVSYFFWGGSSTYQKFSGSIPCSSNLHISEPRVDPNAFVVCFNIRAKVLQTT